MLKEIQIDSSHVKGEAGTGYEGPEKGPFSCSNCEFYSKGSCGQSTMMERSKLPKTENGRVVVDPGGCCEYVNRKGEKKEATMKKSWMKPAGKSSQAPDETPTNVPEKGQMRPGKRITAKKAGK
jgi:hypothetical protein